MAFFFSVSGTVLFEPWTFNTIGGLIGSMIAIFVIAFGYEGVKFYRAYLLAASIELRQKNKAAGDDAKLTILSKAHIIQTIWHLSHSCLAYYLMLIFMTYNMWLCLAVLLGLVAGYFVFGYRTPVINTLNTSPC